MIEPEVAANIEIVMVDPQYSGNIGQAARAMANNGLSRLSLIRPPDHLDLTARKMALNAIDILHDAEVYNNLGDALVDKRYVLGTTNRLRTLRKTYYTPRAAVRPILDLARQHQVAIMFGNEAAGLSNEDLDRSHEIIHIPAHRDFSSYNLAQTVMIVAYELFNSEAKYASPPKLKLAPLDQIEPMYDQIQQVLLDIGYLHEENPAHIMTSLRRLFGRSGLEEREVRIIRGIFAQMRWLVGDRDKWRKIVDLHSDENCDD